MRDGPPRGCHSRVVAFDKNPRSRISRCQNAETRGIRQTRHITRLAFWPPNPKLFEMAARTGFSRAGLGT